MKCHNCNEEHDGSYGSGKFCSQKCARSFATKFELKFYKTSTCKKCGKIIKIGKRAPSKNVLCINCKTDICPKCGSKMKIGSNLCRQCNSSKPMTQITKNKLSKIAKKRCKSIKERQRLRDIGRKGGFGKQGFTSLGTRYESTFERKAFEYLEINNYEFIPHKPIPNSSKVSDIFLPKFDLYIELDGINREKKKEWLGDDYKYWKQKLKIYEQQKLNYQIFYTIDEFIATLAQLGERLVYTEEVEGAKPSRCT